MCFGTAIYGADFGLARCTCDRPTTRRANGEADPWTQILGRLDRIEKTLKFMPPIQEWEK